MNSLNWQIRLNACQSQDGHSVSTLDSRVCSSINGSIYSVDWVFSGLGLLYSWFDTLTQNLLISLSLPFTVYCWKEFFANFNALETHSDHKLLHASQIFRPSYGLAPILPSIAQDPNRCAQSWLEIKLFQKPWNKLFTH